MAAEGAPAVDRGPSPCRGRDGERAVSGTPEATPDQLRRPPVVACPEWCVTPHGSVAGEEDWVHAGEPLPLTDGVQAQTCSSVDPGTGETDGPYVVIGWSQYTPAEAEALGMAIVTMARRADPRP